jgi:c-di-GMP-binding flagellar brake protein YcgR
MARLSSSTRVRAPATKRIEIQIMGPGYLEIVEASDLSLGGVGVRIPHGFEGCDLSMPVDLILTFPSQKPFMVQGRVVHRRSENAQSDFFGIEFTRLSRDHHKIIEKYITTTLEEDPSLSREPRATGRRSR